ncbi:MAG: Transcriptional regulator, LysR family protein [Myxococcaceae bacterium]|nr:Transcriptional regulator, LysR family protein [Myxococcaceae bacterium]
MDNLRCFVAAAETLNFRAAAKAVALTPAALGQRVKQLEDEVGHALFARTTRSVALTAAGLAMLPEARRTLAAAETCLRAARGELGPAPSELVLGTRHELGLSWLLPQLPRLAKQRPDLTLHLYVSFTADLLLRVRTREVDCAVLSARFSDPALDSVTLHREDYVFVASKALLARNPLSKPEHAAAHTLIDVSAEMPLFRYWREAAGATAAGMRFAKVLRMGTIAAIEHLVLRGDGVAVLPEYLVQKRVESGALRVVFPKVKPEFDHFRLVFRADDARRPDYEGLAAMLLESPLR